MKNLISILILVITFGCNENRKNNIYQKKANVIDSININDDTLMLKGIIKYEEKDIELNTEISEINKKDTKATYSVVATYLGSAINDYYLFGFEGEDGKYYDFSNCKNNLGDIPFTNYDIEINSELIGKKFIINWKWKTCTYNCCEGEMNLYEDDFPSILSIEYHTNDSVHKKISLIKNINIKETKYQLYENLVFFGHDTINASWSTESLSLFKNGIFNKHLYKDDFLIDHKLLKQSSYGEIVLASNNVYFNSTVVSDEEKIILMFNVNFDSSALEESTFSFIQFEDQQVKHSGLKNIYGNFTIKNGDIYAVIEQGYYSYELPYKLLDNLDLDLDYSKIHHENNRYFLNINDSIKFPPRICELELTINPFGDKPLSTTKVTLNPNTKVTLIYKDMKSSWIKIQVSDQQGWIEVKSFYQENGSYENYDDLKIVKIGCHAAG